MADLAPVLVFCYNRLESLKKTIHSLSINKQSPESDLFIFSDAAKGVNDIENVNAVREYIRSLTGFRSVQVIEAEKNQGLANAIINGVSNIINQYGKAIVLEDDLLLADNFLAFMNQALFIYEKDSEIFSVSGFMFDITLKKNYSYDVFFTMRHCSWGWGMWADRWNEIDWEVKDYKSFLNSSKQQEAFNKIGSDLSQSLIKQMSHKINSWAIRCNYHQFKKKTYTVYPLKSKVVNIGFDIQATHTTQKINKYSSTLDQTSATDFNFPETVILDRSLIKKFSNKFSKRTRLFYYLVNKFYEKNFLRLGKK